MEDVAPGQVFKRVVEIGCNDLYLLDAISHKGECLFGIDPIWEGKEPPSSGKMSVIGKFVEEVEFSTELGGKPDLILSSHTMEHIDDPKGQLTRLVDTAEEEALYVIEVPSFDCLLANHRFDQVFHQHMHYFSLSSIQRIIDEIGAVYLTHTYNYQYFGGTMLVAFKKRSDKRPGRRADKVTGPSEKLLKQSYQIFSGQLANLMRAVEMVKDRPIYGYGAAQMLPVLAYHMHTDLAFLESVLDDNPARCGLTYPHLPVWIRQPEEGIDFREASVLITALDSIRPILMRLIPLKPRQLLVPLNPL